VIPQRTLIWLVAGTLILPIALALVLGLARLLGAMGDAGGQIVLDRVGLALGIIWALNLIGLVVVLGMNSLLPPGTGDE
jgi:hypothetical protein